MTRVTIAVILFIAWTWFFALGQPGREYLGWSWSQETEK